MQQHTNYYEVVGFHHATIPSPEPLEEASIDPDKVALLLDFDGTLVDIAETPDSVVFSRGDHDLCQRLLHRLKGAVAIISGRNLDDILNFVGTSFGGSISGGHGAELRHEGEVTRQAAHDAERLEHIKNMVMEFCVIDPRVVAEDKTYGIVLHYRQNPEMESRVRSFLESLIPPEDEFEIQPAKMAFEIKPKSISKAVAVERIMECHPFAGRIPVYAGDDTTDETAFAYVNDHNGITIKIGEGQTVAKYRVSSPAAFKKWLTGLVNSRRS